MKSIIEKVNIEKILDSRGNVTVEVEIKTANGFGRAAAPSGASTGMLEVNAFPEEGIDYIINNFEKIVSSKIIGTNSLKTSKIDFLLKEIDGTDDFSYMGGNIAVAISLASIKAATNSYDLPLYMFLGGNMANEMPYPLGNMINGGAHAGRNAPDIQEFLVVPTGAKNIYEAIITNSEVHKRIGEYIKKIDKNFTGGKGDEGGWAPNLSNFDALEIQTKSCEEITEETGITVKPALDLAPSNIWDGNNYIYPREGIKRDSGEQIDFVKDIIEAYGMIYVEDPLEEKDFSGFAELTKKLGKDCLICGDDIFVTNSKLLAKGINMGAANSIIIKPNQIGTISDTCKTIKLAKKNNYMPVVSHRSGETTDSSIAHLSVGFACPLIKTGAISGERIAKLNELVRIEKIIDNSVMNNEIEKFI